MTARVTGASSVTTRKGLQVHIQIERSHAPALYPSPLAADLPADIQKALRDWVDTDVPQSGAYRVTVPNAQPFQIGTAADDALALAWLLAEMHWRVEQVIDMAEGEMSARHDRSAPIPAGAVTRALRPDIYDHYDEEPTDD